MNKLPDNIYDEVDRLSECGNQLLETQSDWRGAIAVWNAALRLLPEPATQWEAALWLYASIGDAYRQGGELEHAKDMLLSALNCPDGHVNAFALLRLGQTLVDLGETERGAEHLLRAYMLEGHEIFEEDGEAYLKQLRDSKLIT